MVRIASKGQKAEAVFGAVSPLYETTDPSPVASIGVALCSNICCRSEGVERRNGRFSYKRLAECAKLSVMRPIDGT
jgi:hypothetical protein